MTTEPHPAVTEAEKILSIADRIERAMAHEGCTRALAMVIPQAPAPKWDEKQRQAFLDRLPKTCDGIAELILTDIALSQRRKS